MADHLARFAARAREAVERGLYAAGPRAARRASVGLKASIFKRPPGLVAEIKPASPSAGKLRDVADPAALASGFASAGAAGVSVLTEPVEFGGSLASLADVAAKVDLPVLMKDFVVDPAQVDAAARAGASAVLLLMPLFERGLTAWEAPAQAVAYAHSRGLEVLLEVADEAGFRRARATKADVIGINNRDLATLAVDPGRAARVLAAERKDRPVLALSAIETAADVARARAAGADGVLVGTALMRAPDPAALARSLVEGAR
ncbi:MAG TPA: indole-3-glycerol-phosphate synthase [Candidatus Thermoplasmatota archaeon]|nr:indole-3-glycerol-phosphate synthase [Candidatus Thermoplasmatota archaeon]